MGRLCASVTLMDPLPGISRRNRRIVSLTRSILLRMTLWRDWAGLTNSCLDERRERQEDKSYSLAGFCRCPLKMVVAFLFHHSGHCSSALVLLFPASRMPSSFPVMGI